MPILIEVAVAGVEDAKTAAAAGADRLELCSALELGGLTPSLGTFLAVKQAVSIPIVTMVRPRQGGFVYSAAELAVMDRDADLFLSNGAAGIVFGFLTAGQKLDNGRIERFVRLAGGKQTVFHRAFDLLGAQLEALEELIGLGVRRVLTSGGEASAPAGVEQIARLVEQARGRIEILPGGGIGEENVSALVARSGVRQIHGTFSEIRQDEAMPVCSGEFRVTSGRRIDAIRATLNNIRC